MKLPQVSPIPRSLVRLKGQAIATYDVVAFLDTRAKDLGGRAAAPVTPGPVCKREDQLADIAVAIVSILAVLGFTVVLSLKVLHP